MKPLKREIQKPIIPQRLQLRKAVQQMENPHFITTIYCGHSDFGGSGIRSAWQMGRIRRLLLRRKDRFESVCLLGLSDETLWLYAAGFDQDLKLVDIWPVLSIYEDEIRKIDHQPWSPWRKRYEVLSVYLWARARLRLPQSTHFNDEDKVSASI